MAFSSMNIQKHCIKNVEGSRQRKMIYLIFTDGYKHPQIQNGHGKNRHGNGHYRSAKQKDSLENRLYVRLNVYNCTFFCTSNNRNENLHISCGEAKEV